jgi:dihydrolipoamide dehydrogenase
MAAGVIGCEFAAIMANFGQTRVHLVNERRARLLPSEDEDLSAFITEAYKVRVSGHLVFYSPGSATL